MVKVLVFLELDVKIREIINTSDLELFLIGQMKKAGERKRD